MLGRVTTARESSPRPRWWDAGIAGLYLALGAVTLGGRDFRLDGVVPDAPTWLRLAVAAVACVPLLWRSRYPVAVLAAVAVPLAVDVALGLSLTGILVLTDVLYCSVLHGSVRLGWVVRRVAVVLWGLGVAAVAVLVPDTGAVLGTALLLAGLLLLPVFWSADVRRRVDEAAAARAAAAQARRIAELDRRGAVADERARIARDLHDSVAGHLSAISLQSQAALRAGPETRERVLGAVRETSVRALGEMRAMIEVLHGRAEPGPGAGGLGALPALVLAARAAGLEVHDHSGRDDVDAAPELPRAIDLTAYRIVQEALTNAATHAPGARVDLGVTRRPGDLVVEVVNDRTRTDGAGAGPGTGVEGMRMRAAAVDGHAEIGPDGDGGRWRVRVVLPVSGTVAP